MPDLSELLRAHLKGPIPELRALGLATVAYSIPYPYAFKNPGVGELWQDATLRAVQANLVTKFGLGKSDVLEQINLLSHLIKESQWQVDYDQTQTTWLCAASRAQLFLALDAGLTLGRQHVKGIKQDMVHAVLSYHRQILAGGKNYRNQNGGLYLDDIDLRGVSYWLYRDYGRVVGYRNYKLTFPYNPAEKPLRFFDCGDAIVSLGLGYWTSQVATAGKHGRFRLYLPGWISGVRVPQLPDLGIMPDWTTGQIMHYENNQFGLSAYEAGEI